MLRGKRGGGGGGGGGVVSLNLVTSLNIIKFQDRRNFTFFEASGVG